MADRTIGGLDAVQESSIGDLPAISTLYDDTKIPVEQQGEAMHMTGAQWKTYAQAGVSQYVEEAKTAANTAQQAVSNVQSSVTAAASSASSAETSKIGAELAKTGAEAAQAGAETAKESIENMTVSASTLETNEPATVSKTIQDGVVNLAFGLPKGAQGIRGDTGSSIQSIERTEGTGAEGTFDTYTIMLTDDTVAGTFQVYNGADGNGAGDMVKSVYDSQNRNTDIFKYFDGKAITVPGSGTVQVPESLGAGPYMFEFSEEGEDTEAVNVSYSNTESGLTAVNTQEAIDELAVKVDQISEEETVGKSLAGKEVQPDPETTVTAGEGAEIFNDYRERTFGTDEGGEIIKATTGNVASGIMSHAEGGFTTARGQYAHAEGSCTEASGNSSHAEGGYFLKSKGSAASEYAAHAEGISTIASGKGSHAEGSTTTASGQNSHAEGYNGIAEGSASHVEGGMFTNGRQNKATGYAAHAEGAGVLASGEESHAEGINTTASGIGSHAEGDFTVTSGYYSHAEGYRTYSMGEASHAEGHNCLALRPGHVEGYLCAISAYDDVYNIYNYNADTRTITLSKSVDANNVGKDIFILDGYQTTIYQRTITAISGSDVTIDEALGVPTANHEFLFAFIKSNVNWASSGVHAEGYKSVAVGAYASHAEGYLSLASGNSSHSEGYNTIASGNRSHAGGMGSISSGECSFAQGLNVIASQDDQSAFGQYNVEESYGYLVVGKGTNSGRANAFRVTSSGVFASGDYNASGADYAELFEWLDGNPESQDRVGLFVTLDGNKIRIASSDDDFILGIVSGAPSVVGDVYDDQWKGMFMTDVFGRPIFEDVEIPEEIREEIDPEDPENTIVHIVSPSRTEHRQKINPDYDNTQKYTPRTQRKEWDAVGMMGKLVAIDDGSCEINGWATVGNGGIATKSNSRTKYRVMDRIDESHILILIL